MKTFKERNQEDSEFELDEDDFIAFKKLHKSWLDKFHLSEWNCIYEFTQLNEAVLATTSISIKERSALIKLNNHWPNYEYEETFSIERVAKHEAIHLLTADLSNLAEERYTSKQKIWRIEEILVVKLEKLL
jgi:hypothetical protein